MAFDTPKGLHVWDLLSDLYNHEELAENFILIDDLLDEPTQSVESGTALPGSGNFAGRLFYLTAANGGFAAHTLVRFDGTGWKSVGAVEIHGAVPSTGNYVGRIVLLSLAASGFNAWDLIRFDGSGWSKLGPGLEVLSAVPGTGNYAGRVIVLSSAGSGFNAYDVIRYNGSTWHRIGPYVLEDLSITTGKLANLAVTEGKIANGAVTSGKLAGGFLPSFLEMQELFHTTAGIDISGSATVVNSGNITLPVGWGMMDVMLMGQCTLTNNFSNDIRMTAWVESPSSTQIGPTSAASVMASGTYPTEPISVPLSAHRMMISATTSVRIMAQVTGGNTTLGNSSVTNRHLMAFKVRTA